MSWRKLDLGSSWNLVEVRVRDGHGFFGLTFKKRIQYYLIFSISTTCMKCNKCVPNYHTRNMFCLFFDITQEAHRRNVKQNLHVKLLSHLAIYSRWKITWQQNPRGSPKKN